MEHLLSHADRAVARHMLTVMGLAIAVVVVGYIGYEFLSFGEALGASIAEAGQ